MNKSFSGVNGSAEVMLDVINAIMETPNGQIVCDLMCCEGSITGQLNVGQIVYVDIQNHDIKYFHKERNDKFILMDALEYLEWTEKKFTTTIALDAIEHISKSDGYVMLELMKEKSICQIIFTPLGDFVVEPETTNPDGHKSGWLPEELEKLGWATITFPDFHKAHGTGAFFGYHYKDVKPHSERIINELNQKSWASV